MEASARGKRAVQLGGTAEGTIQVATTRPGLKAYPLTLMEERDHVEALSSALAPTARSVRQEESSRPDTTW